MIKKTIFWLIIIILVFTSCQKATEINPKNNVYFLGDNFTFNNFEIKIKDKIEIVKEYDIYNKETGKEYIKITLKVKNKEYKSRSLSDNNYYYEHTGPNGNEIPKNFGLSGKNINQEPIKDKLNELIKYEEEKEVFYYIQYFEDGEYTTRLYNLFDKDNEEKAFEIKININK